MVQTATYDASSRLESIKGTRGATTLTGFTYDHKLAGEDTGLRQSVTDLAGKPRPGRRGQAGVSVNVRPYA